MDSNILKNVTINDDVYVIKKFDAKTGLKIARLIMAKAAPILPLLEADAKNPDQQADAILEGKNRDQVYEMVGRILGSLTDEDLDSLIDKCLRVCSKQLPAGLQPVIDAVGNYGIPDVEYDLPLTIRLVFEAISWGASDFFDGKSLAGILHRK